MFSMVHDASLACCVVLEPLNTTVWNPKNSPLHFYLGSLTVIERLDYEMRKKYELTVRATDILTGSYAEAIVHINLEVKIIITLLSVLTESQLFPS